MMSIKKSLLIDRYTLSNEYYVTSILQAAHNCGMLYDADIENIQLQCITFLADKSKRYNSGDSRSIREEIAESIMQSNLYTMGVFLKSLPDTDCAVSELKTARCEEMYRKGRELINIKYCTAKHLYKLVRKNKLSTINYTYNATLSDEGIGNFFKMYNPDFEAHETPSSIDYQLCNPVVDLTGIEYIQKYLGKLYLENEFCEKFSAEAIHCLLSGYDEGYEDLLINIFEQVLTAAVGCVLANVSVERLNVSTEAVGRLQQVLSQQSEHSIHLIICEAAEKVLEVMSISNNLLRQYVQESLPNMITNIVCAIQINTLSKVILSPNYSETKPQNSFFTGEKMDDEDYRKLIGELLLLRYLSDKLALIKEKVKSFGDFEDILLDAQLDEQEITSVFSLLGDVEMAALIKRYPVRSDIQAVDLSVAEALVRSSLKNFMDQLGENRQVRIFAIVNQLIDVND
jgi:hypothetical protein